MLKYKKRDLRVGILHYNTIFHTDLTENDITLKTIELLKPNEIFNKYIKTCGEKGWTYSFFEYLSCHEIEEGWLDVLYGSNNWIEQMEKQELRPFRNIINNYFNCQTAPIIIIDKELCDGYGRVIFYHAIGEKLSIAKFRII